MRLTTDKQKIAAEVFRIAEELICLSQRDSMGTFWLTPGTNEKAEHPDSVDLFNGSAGIIIFLLSLYRYKPDNRYLNVALSAANRVLNHDDTTSPRFFTFYGGAAGILYLCVQLFQVTDNSLYIEKAIELAKGYDGEMNNGSSSDFLSGRSGKLLALCHLYAVRPDPGLLKTIRAMIGQLIDDACISSRGLRWDLHKNAFDSLTGFSHGNAGIAFALMEVGKFFKAPGLQYLATQALSYEQSYFDAERGNWMDLRVGVDRMHAIMGTFGRQLLDWPLDAFRPTMSGISSWAHGAAGCGIARLTAFAVTSDHQYATQAQAAIDYSWEYFLRQEHIDYTICSGYGGIAALCQLAAKVLGQPMLQEKACDIALSAIDYYKEHRNYNSKLTHQFPDPGLFSGLAGIGYWMLGCLIPYSADAIIFPSLPGSNEDLGGYDLTTVKKSIFTRYFTKTIEQITANDPGATDVIIHASPDINSVERELEVYMLRNKSDVDILNVFTVEQQLVNLWKEYRGTLRYRQGILLQKEFVSQSERLTVEQWLELSLVKVKHIATITNPDDSSHVVVYCIDKRLQLVKVSNVAVMVLNSFRAPALVKKVLGDWQINYFASESKEDVQRLIIERVKELVKGGFLTNV